MESRWLLWVRRSCDKGAGGDGHSASGLLLMGRLAIRGEKKVAGCKLGKLGLESFLYIILVQRGLSFAFVAMM